MWGTVPGPQALLWLSSGAMHSRKINLAGETQEPQRGAGNPCGWGVGRLLRAEGSADAWAAGRNQGGHPLPTLEFMVEALLPEVGLHPRAHMGTRATGMVWVPGRTRCPRSAGASSPG